MCLFAGCGDAVLSLGWGAGGGGGGLGALIVSLSLSTHPFATLVDVVFTPVSGNEHVDEAPPGVDGGPGRGTDDAKAGRLCVGAQVAVVVVAAIDAGGSEDVVVVVAVDIALLLGTVLVVCPF